MTLLHNVDRVVRRVLKLQGVHSREVQTPAGPVHLYDARGTGTLPTLVILHGIGANATAYAPLMPILRRHFSRIVVPDAPAHGFSTIPAAALSSTELFKVMADAVDGELKEPAIVFGNSLGGGMALRYALERPKQVRALILSSPAGAVMDKADWDGLLGSFKFSSTKDALRFVNRLYHKPPWYLPVVAPSVREVFARPAIRDFLLGVTPDDLYTPEQLGRLGMPGLLLWGKSEKLMPPSNLRYFKEHLPRHMVVEEPEDFGHCPYLDRPGKLARRMVEFAQHVTRTQQDAHGH